MRPVLPGQSGEPLNFFHFNEQQKKGGLRGWYDQQGYTADKERRGIAGGIRIISAGIWAIITSVPIPSVKTVLILALICATPYGARRGYKEYLRREEAAPKITVYLNQNCYGENILLTLQDGFDMETKRASGRGYELCKITFPEGMNANDQVRSIRIARGMSVDVFEHCSGPFKTQTRDASGQRRTSGPFQPLSEALKGGRFMSACHNLKGKQLLTSFIQLVEDTSGRPVASIS